MALFDEAAFIAVDTELLEGNPRKRFQSVEQYIAFLRASGYPLVYDHQAARLDRDDVAVRDFAARLASAGGSRWLDRLKRDARFGFAFCGVAYALVSAVSDARNGVHLAFWPSFARALWFGTFMGAVQYWVARTQLRSRVQQVRDAIVTERTADAPREIRKSWSETALEIIAVLMFGGFAAVGFGTGSWTTGVFLAAMCAVTIASLAVGSRRTLALTDRGLESHARGRHTRVDYADVLQIVQWPAIDTMLVATNLDWVLVPPGFDDRRQVSTIVWDRVLGSLEELEPGPIGVDTEWKLRESLAAARTAGFRLDDFALPPLWMCVRGWRHPVKGQYLRQRRLLRDGRLVLARILAANELLSRPPRDESRFDCPAIVLYAIDARAEDCLDRLNRIAADLTTPDSSADAAKWFQSAMIQTGGFPMALRVPDPLAGGLQAVYCTTVMVVRRHIPLGMLRSPWIPLLVSPPSPFTSVVPMRIWGSELRSTWRRGGEAISESKNAGNAVRTP